MIPFKNTTLKRNAWNALVGREPSLNTIDFKKGNMKGAVKK